MIIINGISSQKPMEMQYLTPKSKIWTVFALLIFSNRSIAQGMVESDTLNLYFPLNSHTLSPNQKFKLDSFTAAFCSKDVKLYNVTIIGQTDTFGTKKYNDILALWRCREVERKFRKALHSLTLNYILLAKGETSSGLGEYFDRKSMIVIEKDLKYKIENDNLTGSKVFADSTFSTKDEILTSRDKTSPLKDLKVDTIILLENVYFVPEKPIIANESYGVLPNYLYLLRKYPNRHIEIRGHVNHELPLLPPTDPLFMLSINRAKVIYDYLVEHGARKELISFKGLGNSQLIYNHPQSLDEKLKNMRVEVVIYSR